MQKEPLKALKLHSACASAVSPSQTVESYFEGNQWRLRTNPVPVPILILGITMEARERSASTFPMGYNCLIPSWSLLVCLIAFVCVFDWIFFGFCWDWDARNQWERVRTRCILACRASSSPVMVGGSARPPMKLLIYLTLWACLIWCLGFFRFSVGDQFFFVMLLYLSLLQCLSCDHKVSILFHNWMKNFFLCFG